LPTRNRRSKLLRGISPNVQTPRRSHSLQVPMRMRKWTSKRYSTSNRNCWIKQPLGETVASFKYLVGRKIAGAEILVAEFRI
jgi:hypothetical protein